MSTIQMLILFLIVIVIVVLKSFIPARSNLSYYETKRLIDAGDKKIQEIVNRENALDLLNLIFELISLVLFTVAMFIIFTKGELVDNILTISFVILAIFFIPKFGLLKNLSNRFFALFEKPILKFFSQRRFLLKFVVKTHKDEVDINSTEEFRHIVDSLPNYIIGSDSRKIISSGLVFDRTIVKEIMTPYEEVKYVEKSEFLGPLVLDELHRLKHNKLPVISKSFNQVVGILYLDKLLSLDIKRSTTAEKIMDSRVEYVNQEETLRSVLTKMINSELNIVIVKKDDKNIGIVTMRDVLEFLVGQELVVAS